MRKKKNKRELIKKGKNIFKKASDAEKKKSDRKKQLKRNKPKGMGAKKLGMITFWLLFSFMLLVTFVSIFSSGNSNSAEGVEITSNKLYENEGLEFAKDFVYQYFTWSVDKHGREKHIHNLNRYMLNSVDELGGVMHDNEWSSSIDKRDITLKDVQKINDEQARYVFKVKFTLKSRTDEENTNVDISKLSFEDLLKEEQKMKVVNGYKTKTTEKYISVPVYYNKEINRFAVFGLPSFTFISEGKLDDFLDNDLTTLRVLSNGYVENNLRAFLETFFESYSRDGIDKLNYILEDKRHQNGLNGTMEFVSIRNSKIYKANENENRFIVDADVVLKDVSTKFEFTNNYKLVIKRKDQRYVVESLNDEKYISEIVKDYNENYSKQNNNQDKENIEDFNYQRSEDAERDVDTKDENDDEW